MRVEIHQPAPDDGTTFSRDAFDRVIGEAVRFNAPGYRSTADIIAAEVAEDGRSVTITVEITDPRIAAAIRDMGCGAHFDGQAFSLTGWEPAEPRGADR